MLGERGMSQAELSLRLGRTQKNLSEIISGKAQITAELALELEHVLGAPASFWNNREARYREALVRNKRYELSQADIEWVKAFPYRVLVNSGLLPAAKATEAKYEQLLRFFGVADREAFNAWQASAVARYRRSLATKPQTDLLIAAWLREGERQATEIRSGMYSAAEFESAIRYARTLTCMSPDEFLPLLKSRFQQAGVVLLLVPELPAMGVSGATRWLGQKPVIQVTFRYKTTDQFWFTMFHESCHILRHPKRAVFLETNAQSHDATEAEANRFAADLLIPPSAYDQLIGRRAFTRQAIGEFATGIGVCPGIVVGRLQRDGQISYSHFNDLKVKFQPSNRPRPKP
ncbi:MAG: ImmA/IrrE family metallo-endopeptidase [Fimbriimonadaceae bacterium]|nr:ImmA/IrrE family metallo-endopeptidase [Fimbriimonadaceae bacterium]